MHKKLLLMAFDKVRRALIDEGHKSPSVNRCAQELSSIISKDFVYGERRLRDYYKEAIRETEGDIDIPQQQVRLALAKYLGYEDFRDFENKNSPVNEKGKIVSTGNKNESPTIRSLQGDKYDKLKRKRIAIRVIISISFLTVLCFFGYHYFNEQPWMEWDGTRYVEAQFDSKKLEEGNLKAYKEERINDFKKILPNCETKFFNVDGSVRVWYGKNNEGILQYFTNHGLHPETGKTLKPITKYMIERHICFNSEATKK